MKSNHKNSNFSSKFLTGLELCRNFILSLNQAKIIVLKDNLEEKRDFLKKVGSNHILKNRQLIFLPKIPYDLVAERSEVTAKDLTFPYWLAFYKLARTEFKKRF